MPATDLRSAPATVHVSCPKGQTFRWRAVQNPELVDDSTTPPTVTPIGLAGTRWEFYVDDERGHRVLGLDSANAEITVADAYVEIARTSAQTHALPPGRHSYCLWWTQADGDRVLFFVGTFDVQATRDA